MTMTRRSALALLAAATGASLLPLHMAHSDPVPETLNAIARRKGLRFGNAIGGRPFEDTAYRALMARECGVIVAENETKWQAIQARPGQFNFAAADKVFAWAKSEGMQIRGHTLVWQPAKWLPQWVNEHDFGSQPVREAERLLRGHITKVCGHFGKDIYSYDVVNEAVEPESGGLRRNVFTERLGAVEQIDLAFRIAREQAPHAQLVYNDYMRWDAGSAKHRKGVLELLRALKARGTPVHALGLQSHIGSWDESNTSNGEAMLEWRRFLDEVTAMDLDLLITEFDVNDRKLPAALPARDAGVAALARDYLDVTLSYPRLRDFLLWGMADHVSWLQSWDEAPRLDNLPMRPTPYSATLQAKPLRQAIAAALQTMPPRA
ncbi:endo-1,4-beta-xylanase [Pseudoduganella sp. LjRoot289]|uniref:endo-1,4-beta-xylanase n=1 Tax=Pseudoduganella sp. LjRoot289 TaxID=3342314 RepID=UPI003ECD5B92